MTTETVLTDEQIGDAIHALPNTLAMRVARAIERAVLQSPELQRRMEAYAAARVRDALEEAVAAVESCRTSGTIRHGTVNDCIQAIRALIPKE